MSDLTLRLVKGSPLTNAEVDNNFSNLNITKVEIGGDISGNVTIPLVSGLQGRDIGNIEPSNGQSLIWISGNNAWEPGTVSGGSGTTNYNDLTNKPAANIVLTGNITGSSNVSLTANTNIINVNTTLENTGVIAASYGSSSLVPVITVDAKGRITTASTVAVSGGGGSTAISFKTSFLLMGA